MKNRFYWNEDTLEYFKEVYTKNKNDYYREVKEFVKYNCHLEDGETYQDLMVDLINQTN